MKRAMLLALLLLCALAAYAGYFPQPTPTPGSSTIPTGWGTFYGTFSATDLSNVGIHPADAGNYADIEFRSQYSGTLSAFRLWLMGTTGSSSACPGGTTYCGGNCGIYTVGLYGDDGSTGHFPSGYPGSPIGSTFTITTQGVGTTQSCTTPSTVFENALRTWPGTAPTVTAGSVYHLIWKNTDAAPDTNFTSIDFLTEGGAPGSSCVSPGIAETPPQHQLTFSDWNLYLSSNGTTWARNPNNFCMHNSTPTVDLTIGAHHQGFGSIQIGLALTTSSSDYRCIGMANGTTGGTAPNNWICGGGSAVTNAEVRELFTPAVSHTVTGVCIHVARLTGLGNLTAALMQGASTVEALTFFPSAFPTDTMLHWACSPFNSSHTLAAGTSYSLTLSTNTTTAYATVNMQDGNKAGYGYDAATTFPDGNSQYSFNGGSTWTNWDIYNATTTFADMEFYFTLN